MYKLVIRPLLFLFPPEFIHNISFIMIKIICMGPFMTSILRIYFSNKILPHFHPGEEENKVVVQIVNGIFDKAEHFIEQVPG